MILLPPRSTLFPYTTLFRSLIIGAVFLPQKFFLREAVMLDTAVASYFTTADRKSTRLNSSHVKISYAVFCLKKKKKIARNMHTYTGWRYFSTSYKPFASCPT